MGTGIVGGAAATLPIQFPGLRVWATVIWGLAAFLLVALTGAWAVHWVRHTATARSHAANPVTGPCPPRRPRPSSWPTAPRPMIA